MKKLLHQSKEDFIPQVGEIQQKFEMFILRFSVHSALSEKHGFRRVA